MGKYRELLNELRETALTKPEEFLTEEDKEFLKQLEKEYYESRQEYSPDQGGCIGTEQHTD